MRILISGATGFVGGHLLDALSEHELFALHSFQSSPKKQAENLAWLRCDFNDGIDRTALPSRIDTVVHLAASYAHRSFPERAIDMFNVNTKSTAELLDYALQSECRHFVYASTGSVYSSDSEAPFGEDSKVDPSQYFAATKAAGELLVKAYSAHMTVLTLRLFFPYGPRQTDRLIPGLIARVRSGEAVTLAAPDGLICPFLYIDDAVQVMSQAINERWQGLFNVAGPRAVTLREIAAIIAAEFGTRPRFDMRSDLPATSFAADLTRLRGLVEVDQFVGAELGIARTIAAIESGAT